MVRIRLRLKALSPVAFSARRGTTSNFVDTLDYVPGSAFRGAAAARYLSRIGEAADPRFQALFVNGEASFGNLYPVRYGLRSSVVPSTARSCKAFEGFRSKVDQTKHGVVDSLMLASSAQLSQDFSLLEAVADCAECRLPTHRFSGFYEDLPVSPGDSDRRNSIVYSKVDINKRNQTHVGINRASQSAEPGFLYAQQVISESWQDKVGVEFKPQVFAGDLLVSDPHAEYVQNALLPSGSLLRLGESRSRGLGRMEVEDITPVAPDSEATISERLQKFNESFADKTRAHDVEYISVTLHSDAIITDSFLRHKTTIRAEDITRALDPELGSNQIEAGSLVLVYANAETKLAQSWNVASGYPKPDAISIAMGSVFLFKLSAGKAADLAKPLQALQELGIGERRSEGFGRLRICDSFHWEVQEYGQPSR